MPSFETYGSLIPLWAVLVSLLAVPLIVMSGRWPNLREGWTLVAAGVKFGLVFSLLPGALAGNVAEVRLLAIAPGVELALRADAFGVFFALIASGLWILTSFYSIGYMRGNGEAKQTRYYASFAVSLAATIGIAFSANLLTFVVFYEILTLATYPLVVHKESAVATRAGRQYLAYALSAGLLLVVGSAWVYSTTGTLDFRAGGILGDADTGAAGMRILFVIFVAGVGVKAGLMPLHSWLPAAMVAPTPVSALLHAVAVVKSGVFGMVRVTGFVFGPEVMRLFDLHILLAVFAGATILLASILAMKQTDLKKRLAYSTVAHLSYITMGAALLTKEGFAGGILHISTHATMKITLFFCAGAIYVNTHRQRIADLDGIAKAMPWTMGAFLIGTMGLAGLPPVNGFLSKWHLIGGSLAAGWWIPVVVFLMSGLLNAAYFFPIIRRAYFGKPDRLEDVGEASPLMVVPLCITALLSVLLFVFPNVLFHFYDLAMTIAETVMEGGV